MAMPVLPHEVKARWG